MAQAQILPKGIVVNSPGLNDKLMKWGSRPLSTDEVLKLWKVYTTTQRVLKDPTAIRLENLFWRIMGSKQRQLSSLVVAQMFANISKAITHPSIGTLRSSAPRDESGVPSPRRTARLASGDVVTIREAPQPTQSLRPPKSSLASRNTRNGTSRESQGSSGDSTHRSTLTTRNSAVASTGGYTPSPLSSSMKRDIPMPPPILKKPRGQSSTGPKPTARFVSPAASEDEEETRDDEAVENSDDIHDESPNSHVTIRPPTPPLEESTTPNHPSTKRRPVTHVKPNVGRKKRPTLGRRPSSQSSNGSTGSENSLHRVEEADVEAEEGVSPRQNGLNGGSDRRDHTRGVLENKHVTRATSRSRVVRPRPGRSGSSRTSAPAQSRKGKERAIDDFPDNAAAPVLHVTLDGQRDQPELQEATEQDSTEGLTQHFHEEGRKALEAKKKAEDEALEAQSKKLTSNSRRSMSAANLSAAYRSSRHSISEAPKAAAAVASVPSEFSDLGSDVSSRGSTANGSIKGTENAFAGPKSFSHAPMRGLLSEAPAQALFATSPAITSSLNGVATSRSVSNLTALLQKDDAKKKANDRKSSLGNAK